MKRKVLNSLLTLALVLVFCVPLAPVSVVRAWEASVTLDGLPDADYVLVASDPQGDLGAPGGSGATHWTDLTDLYVAADTSNLYVYAPLDAYTATVSSGQIGLVLDVDGIVNSGGMADPWVNAISFSYDTVDGFTTPGTMLPDYVIRGNIYSDSDDGWTELRTWNGTEWTGSGVNWGGISGSPIGTNIAYAEGGGVEFVIPLADIGNPQPAEVRLQLFTTQGGSDKGAYDTVPSDEQSTGWDDATTQHNLVSVPVATDPAGDLAISWEGINWTDMTRLHLWADHAQLHLFIPMAYTQTVSTGQIGLVLDTKPGGGSSDPWGNDITFAYTTTWQNLGYTPLATTTTLLPDYAIRGNIFSDSDNGWTELRAWNGSNWDTGGSVDWGGIGDSGQPSLPNSKVAWSDGEGLRLTIPFADIDVTAGDIIHLQFFGTQGGGDKGAYDTVPSDDQSTGWDDPTTQEVLASYVIPNIPDPGASHDNNIWWSHLGHNSLDPLYRTPLGAVTTGVTATLRLRAASNDLTGAKVRVWNDYNNVEMMLNMELVADDGTYEWWEAEVPASSIRTIYWYRFIAIDGTDVDYYEDDAVAQGGWGQAYDESEDRSWQITVYDPAFQTPDWVKNTVFYQIFPDRFRDGRPENNVITGTFFYGSGEADTIYRSGGGDWNTAVCDPRDDDGDCPNIWSQNFYGGDLQGVREKLDYLEDLGITSIYFNPIFESPSNHKYDTRNFMVIDDNLAAEGDFDASLAVFTDTVEQAATHGINVILDGVFNHTSSDSIYFDRYERYPEVGACESESSPYRGWYYFEDVAPGTGPCVGSDGTANAATYTSWFGYDSLPKLRADNAEVRDLIYDQGLSSVGPYWVQWADGWRLDVAGDVDPGHVNAPTNDFWEEFRDAVHTVNAETYIVGEEWGNSTPWLLGEEWDASMNYQMGTAIMGFWRDSDFVDNDHNAGSSAGIIRPLSPSQLDERLHYLESRYPPEAFYAMLNLLDSHDTNRALFMLDPNTHLNDPSLYEDPNYDWSTATQRLKGTVILQMTLPGAPTVYYGDELGLVGPVAHDGNVWQDDPYNRQPYPWLDEDGTPYYPHLQSGGVGRTEILPHYQLLIAARTAHEALRTGSFDTLLTDDDNSIYAYGRLLPDLSDAAVVIANGSDVTQTVTLDVEGYLPVGAHFVDVLDGNASHNVGGDGILTVADVPAMSGALLVLSDTVSAPPSAVNDLMVTVEGDGELTLEWSAATGADSYNIYRSLVSGGGYTFVATTTTTIFTDTMVQNSTTYYYVLESRDDTTHLTSEYSNEAWGMPHYSIGWANLSGPTEITHTIGITPTEPITGQVWIDGVTSAPGETEGLIAQVGYGPAVEDPMEWTHWVDASYSHDLSGNDVFSGTLVPEETGEFEYVYRYSTTDGRDWSYADISGLISATQVISPGLLHVLPAADTTPPPVPQNLWVTYWNASSIALAWDAVTAADLYAYDLYREDAGGGPAMVARILAPTTVYTDDTVTTGETYTYTVHAVDENFNKSAPSNEASATAEAREVEVRFIVEVPDFTPDDATVYIAGDNAEVFGAGWNASAQPIAQLDATTWMYTATVGDGTALMYKYTRGSWETVEHWGTLTGFTNRELTVDYGATGVMTVTDTVYNWKDPLVVTTDPSDGALTWSPTDPVSVTFNHTLDTSLINSSTFTLTEYATGQVITGTFSFDEAIVVAYSDPDFGSGPITGTVVLFDPAVSLTADSYKVTLDAPGYKGTDNEGITMRRDYVWYFGIANDLAIAKEVTLQRDPPQPGDTLTYTVYITNTGYASATGVHITDTLPSGVVGIDLDEVITVTAGGVQTFTVPAVVDAGTWAQVITNTAHYSHSSGSGEASAIFTVADAPDLTTSAKVSSFADAQVTPGERITYTVTLTNSSATDASVVVTDTLGNYYTVDNAWDFTEVASGVLRWSEVVTANSEVVLYFVVQVADLAELSVGRTILHNSILIDEGASTPFPVSDPRPPFVEVYGAYLPAVFRNYP